MPRRFNVESREGRLTFVKGGSQPPNRISKFFTDLSSGWLHARQRPHIQLPAPVGGWTHYALTLTPDKVYARCLGFSGDVQEQVFHSLTPSDESNLLTTRVDHFFHAFNETYRQGLERAYGWPRGHNLLPLLLPVEQGKSIMEALYMRYSSLTLVLGSHYLLLTGWSAGQTRTGGYGAQVTVPCTNQSFLLQHGFRWRGIRDEYLETPTLLKQAAKILCSTWPLTGRESE